MGPQTSEALHPGGWENKQLSSLREKVIETHLHTLQWTLLCSGIRQTPESMIMFPETMYLLAVCAAGRAYWYTGLPKSTLHCWKLFLALGWSSRLSSGTAWQSPQSAPLHEPDTHRMILCRFANVFHNPPVFFGAPSTFNPRNFSISSVYQIISLLRVA